MQMCAVSGVGEGDLEMQDSKHLIHLLFFCDFNFYSVIHCPDLKSEISL